ncbi:MAG: DUF1995 family protein [Pseudanabaena sp.]|jgi:hypothetical protein|nr:DUF1995 family protein [Pseudanabaena sp. M079S1SP2A07QC]MCA6586911.1 DUF1995 family protein [Pseudanabaena sp. M051S1SP1A06QC]MCA6590110.1 DUF1995 family protein [Pseudanabaena sp. M109S1SP1A06QC]MCA6606667.1 DUF1995 family protein [Pseudanabaena sp. M007S1SP1A06QC]MCA6613042.1 DUF1995 family protein [Pseudanabaena sp. M158S2SP1A06QC]MCA6616055.1 DUF1995 family protein [Pseudanabaena sp. M090S1SP1A06QC]MCA6621900.1 DUF1995 family protein [Pseudanabaena sp. M165S2SP1A06QC]MCE2974817.1 DUF
MTQSTEPVLLPNNLEDTTEQAIAATYQAIADGATRILVDLRFPELKSMPIAYEFARSFNECYGNAWHAIFSDAGAAALAKREWIDLDVSVRGVNEGRRAIREEDKAFLLVEPSSVEVDQVEKLVQLAGDRPFVMLNPRLENSEVGLGLSARRLRDRFLSTFETAYYIKPLELGALWRCYPQTWQVWVNTEEGMQFLSEVEQRPSSDDIDRIFRQKTGQKTGSFLGRLQELFSALGR